MLQFVTNDSRRAWHVIPAQEVETSEQSLRGRRFPVRAETVAEEMKEPRRFFTDRRTPPNESAKVDRNNIYGSSIIDFPVISRQNNFTERDMFKHNTPADG